jgi:glycosyltransferase involved in cell wall biosynthesis
LQWKTIFGFLLCVLHEKLLNNWVLDKSMKNNKVTIFRSSPCHLFDVNSKEKNVFSFSELRKWIKNGEIFKHLFRYDESKMVTFDLRLMPKPFASALLIRALARKQGVMQDERGASQPITTRVLFSLLSKLLTDLFHKKEFFRQLNQQIKILEKEVPKNPPLDLSNSPLYLRTDLFYGVQAGGSVGHIAGVFNNFDNFTGKPILLTTDRIPTTRADLETHIIFPGADFWDFKEMPSFSFNDVFFNKTIQLVGDRKPAFVYQRYGLNNFSGLKLARHFHIPFVLEYNGSEIWASRWWGGQRLHYEKLGEEIETANLKGCDLVVVISQPLKDQLVSRGISPDKILVNPNGVNPEKYAPSIDGTKIRKQYGYEGKTVLGFIGTFGRWHGAEVLAEAFGMLIEKFPAYRDKVRLLMIGDGITMTEVKENLHKYNVNDISTLTGTIPQEAGPSHLAACDILVASHVPNVDGSPFFGSPTKLFEYMAMGKGIVASDLNQIGEVLKHDSTAWMVKPGDVESLVQGLKTLIDDESKRLRLGQAAREEVVQNYTWKEHTRKIIEKLKERCG